MGRKAGVISIDVQAGTAKFVLDMEKAKGAVREFGGHTVSNMAASSAAIRTLEGNVTNNLRAVERFMATTLGLGPVLQKAFPIVGAIAFAGMIGEMGSKVYDFFKQMKEAPEKVRGAFEGMHGSLQLTNDELELTNTKLANQIAKLEHKPENLLKQALMEARVEADRLGEALDKDLSALHKVLAENEPGTFMQTFRSFAGLKQVNLAKEIGGETGHGGFTGEIDRIKAEAQASIAKAVTEQNREAEESARQEMNKRLLAAYKKELDQVNQHIADTLPDPSQAKNPYYRPPSVTPAYAEELAHLQRVLQQQVAFIEIQTAGARLKQALPGAEKQNALDSAIEANRRETAGVNTNPIAALNAEEREAMGHAFGQFHGDAGPLIDAIRQKFDAKRIKEAHDASEKFNESLREQANHWTKVRYESAKALGFQDQVEEGRKKLEESGKAAAKAAEEFNKLNREAQKQKLSHDVNMVGITGQRSDPLGTLEKQQALERLDIEARYNAALKLAVTPLEKANVERQKAIELDRLKYEMEEKRAAGTKSGLKDFLRDAGRDAKSAGEILYDSLSSALDKTSDELTKLLTGQKTSFKKMFQEIGGQLVHDSIKSGLQRGLGAIGKKIFHDVGKPDGTKSKPFHVVVDGSDTPNKSPGDFKNVSVPGAKSGGFFRNLFRALTGIGGGGGGGGESVDSSITYMANGGNVDPGRPYIVGDGGEPELFTPRTAGTITPFHKMGGVTYVIDARGADLGAHNRIARALESVHNSSVSNSVRANAERAKRSPQRS